MFQNLTPSHPQNPIQNQNKTGRKYTYVLYYTTGTRVSGQVEKMWRGRERVGTGTRTPSELRSRPPLPDPLPSLVSYPTVYCLDMRHFVPVPTFPVLPSVQFFSSPSRRIHTVSPIPQLSNSGSCSYPIIHRSHVFYSSQDCGCNW